MYSTEADEFTAVLCSDPELVSREFDDIIAAEWPAPIPPTRRPTQAYGLFSGPSFTGSAPPAGRATPRLRAAGEGRTRQRSPPQTR